MKIEVKILKGLASAVLPQRELRGDNATLNKGYITNRLVKLIDTYLCLKTLTCTGIIQNYHKQIDIITERCNVGKTTFYTRLNQLATMKLIEKDGFNIRLKSNKHLADLYDLDVNKYYTVVYDTTQKQQSIEYHIRNVEFEESVYKEIDGFERSFAANPHKDLFEEILKIGGYLEPLQQASTAVATTVATVTNSHCNDRCNEYYTPLQRALQRLQIDSFKCGTKRNSFIFSINPFIGRNVSTIRKAHGLKSNKSVRYAKQQLVKRGFRPAFEPFKAVCSPALSHLPDDIYSVKYTQPKGQKPSTFWYMPDEIKPTTVILKPLKTNPLKPLVQKLISTIVE